MKPWFKRNPDVLVKNSDAVKKHFPSFKLRLNKDNIKLLWFGELTHDEKLYYVEIECLQNFPASQPTLYLMNKDRKLINFRDTNHQYPDGGLCLFTWDSGKHAWKRENTIVDALNKLKAFLSQDKNKKISTLHTSNNTPAAVRLPGAFFIPTLPIKIPKNHYGEGTSIKLHPWNIFIASSMSSIMSYTTSEKKKRGRKKLYLENFKIKKNSSKGPKGRFMWITCSNANYVKLLEIRDQSKLNSFFKKYLKRGSKFDMVVVINQVMNNKGGEAICYHLPSNNLPQPETLVARQITLPLGFLQVKWSLPVDEISLRGAELFGKIPDHIFEKKIILVGVGSLGSEIGLQLVKNKFSNFYAIDPDYVELKNISRQAYTLPQINMNKVEALTGLLIQKTLKFNIVITPASVLSQLGISAFEKQLSKDSIIIVTAADPEVEFVINQIALEHKIPCIYASVNAKAEMGRIFRVVPGKTPCFKCVSDLLPECDEPSLLYTFPCDDLVQEGAQYQEGLPGLSFDTMEIANFTARFTFQTLLQLNKIESEYRQNEQDHYFYIIRQREGYEVGIHPQKLEKNPNCEACGEKPVNYEMEKRANEILEEIKI